MERLLILIVVVFLILAFMKWKQQQNTTSTNSSLVPCKDCGQSISKNAEACPHCGAKKTKISIAKWVIVGLAAIFVLNFFSYLTSHNSKSVSQNSPISAAPSIPSNAEQCSKYEILTADQILAMRGKSIATKPMGSDENGLIVEWIYPDCTYTMKRRTVEGVEAYRVVSARSTN